jgi:antitoxin ParD1/3/4
MPTRNINLTPYFDEFIEARVASGEYGNASEIVRDALRLLDARDKEREFKLRALRKAAKTGFDDIDQGRGIVLKKADDVSHFLDDIATKITGANNREGKSRA